MPEARAIAAAILLIIIVATLVSGCSRDTSDNVSVNTSTPVNYSLTSIPTILTAWGDQVDIDQSNFNDSYGLTAAQKLDAIRLVLNDTYVKSEAYGLNDSSLVEYVKDVALANSTEVMDKKLEYYNYDVGYLNVPGLVAAVPIIAKKAGDKWFRPYYANIVVDLTHNRTLLAEEYSIHTPPLSDEVRLPAGSTWYHQLSGIGTVSQLNTSKADYTSIVFQFRDSASNISALEVAVVDGENMTALRNGSTYSLFVWKDALTNEMRMIDGTELPLIDNGTAYLETTMAIAHDSLSYPKYTNPKYYYVVVHNQANREITFDFYIGLY